MIAKCIVNHKLKEVSLWDKQDNRLYYSPKEEDYNFAVSLNLQKDPKRDEISFGYFMGYWKNKIFQLTKRVTGYTW